MESIFSVVFDKAEPLLNMRWLTLKNNLGLPYIVNANTLMTVAQFAEAELGALALHGGSSLNPGLPLTENQKQRQNQVRESDRKRAASLRQPSQQPGDQPKASAPSADAATAAAVTVNGERYSSTTASWGAP